MKKTIIIITIAIFALIAPQTQAALIEIAITAEVDQVYDDDGHLEGRIGAGDIITGRYVYDTSPDNTSTSVGAAIYRYNHSPCGIFLEVQEAGGNGLRFETDLNDVEFSIIVDNRVDRDSFGVISDNNIDLVNGISIGRIFWQLHDFSAEALDDTKLPVVSPVIKDWHDENTLHIAGIPREDEFAISAHVTSAILIPEPTSMVLLALGCLYVRRNRKI